MHSVSFGSEQTDFTISNQDQLIEWFTKVAESENRALAELAFVFCSDECLLDINKRFLSHDYYTDVITFDYSESNYTSGDIFISVDRVSDNAKLANQTTENELHRVMVHGLLHLLGYKDKTSAEKSEMTSKEDFYLALRAF